MKRPAPTRRHLLLALDEHGPMTAWSASEGLAEYQRARCLETMGAAEQAGLVTRAGLGGARGTSVVYALTPAGCVWLDEQDAGDDVAVDRLPTGYADRFEVAR